YFSFPVLRAVEDVAQVPIVSSRSGRGIFPGFHPALVASSKILVDLVKQKAGGRGFVFLHMRADDVLTVRVDPFYRFLACSPVGKISNAFKCRLVPFGGFNLFVLIKGFYL